MLIIAKGRPIEIKCYYATENDGNDSEEMEVHASLAGTACIVGPDYVTTERDAQDETFHRLRFVKWYTIKKFNPCAYALRLRIGEEKIRINDIFSIDTYPAHDNTGLPPGDTVKIRLTIRKAATGTITWAEDITVPGTLECIRVNGSNYYMDDRTIILPDYPSSVGQLEEDANHRTVTDQEKAAWNEALQKITPAASASNQLADKNWVGEQVATASATFRGTNQTATTEQEFLTWADSLTHDENDYVFWKRDDGQGNIYFSRYKFNGTEWLYEYDITSTSFTAEQWAAINSGITEGKINEIIELIEDCATIEQVQNKMDKFSKGAHDLPVWFDENKEPQVIDSLYTPGDIHSDSDIYAYGGVAAGGIADLSHSGSSNEGTTVVEFDPNVEYEEGHEYIPSHGKVKLPAYRDWDDIKPVGGVASEDLEQDVQISLSKADTAYQKPQDGIEKEDLEADVQASLDKADTAVQSEDMPTVVEYGNLGSETTEDTTRIPTAFGVNVIKGHINVEGLTEFSTSVAYKRGDLCKVTDGIGVARGYRFEEGKVAGAWDANKVQRLTYATLAQPLNVTEDDMNSILTIE